MRHLLLLASFLSLGVSLPTSAVAADPEPESAPEAAEQARPRTLYQRIGGTYVIARVVDAFVDAMYLDPALRANAAVKREMKLARKPGLKFQVTSLLCQETGGPCKYDGRTLREAHLSMNITDAEWKAAMADFKKALVTARVPPAERAELTNILDTSKDDVVHRH
jgi:hemoglobin